MKEGGGGGGRKWERCRNEERRVKVAMVTSTSFISGRLTVFRARFSSSFCCSLNRLASLL